MNMSESITDTALDLIEGDNTVNVLEATVDGFSLKKANCTEKRNSVLVAGASGQTDEFATDARWPEKL